MTDESFNLPIKNLGPTIKTRVLQPQGNRFIRVATNSKGIATNSKGFTTISKGLATNSKGFATNSKGLRL
jgi:hypothetical protein